MQHAHWPVPNVVDDDVVAAAAAMSKSSTEGPTEEPTKKPRADSVGATEVDRHGLHLSLHHNGCSCYSASATAERVGSYRIDAGADQVMMPGPSDSALVRKPELVLWETGRLVAFLKRSQRGCTIFLPKKSNKI